MRIHDRVYVVGGGDNSFGLSHALDCTVYLLDGHTGCALVDAGGGVEPERILSRIREAGFSPKSIDMLLLTHAHADHCGGASYLAQQCGARIFATETAAAFLKNEDAQAMSLSEAMAGGVYPKGYSFSFCRPEGLCDGARIAVGDLSLTLLALPGHSDGHCGYLWEYGGRKLLFSGDLAFGKARVSLQKTWDCRFQPYLESLRRVQSLHIDSLLPGHQAFCLDGAHRIFERLLVPTTAMPANL